MFNEHFSKNIGSTSDASNIISDPCLIAYGSKSVELKVIKDVTVMYQNNFLEKAELLEKEKRKLEVLDNQVLSSENSFCEEVWRFSAEHDFSSIFKYYPFVKETHHRAKRENNYEDEKSSELIDLMNEIDSLKAEIFTLIHGENIKRNVENALTNLQKLQLISDNATELIRSISLPESSFNIPVISAPIYDGTFSNCENKFRQRKNDNNKKNNLSREDPSNKKGCSHQKGSLLRNTIHFRHKSKSPFVGKKEMITIPKDYTPLSLERSIVFSAGTTFTNLSTEIQFTNKERNKSFTLKKPSEISIKFEQYHEHKY